MARRVGDGYVISMSYITPLYRVERPPPSLPPTMNSAQVIVEAIETGKEDGTEADFDSEDDHLADEDCCCGSEDENMSGGFSKKPPNRKGAKRIGRRKQASAAATVHMRHEASSVLLTWRTAGVKDTCGEELHEGGAYRLVATVRDPPDVSNRAVEVTRCRLTSVASAEK